MTKEKKDPITITIEKHTLEHLFAGGGENGGGPTSMNIAMGAIRHAATTLAAYESANELDDNALWHLASQLEAALDIIVAVEQTEKAPTERKGLEVVS